MGYLGGLLHLLTDGIGGFELLFYASDKSVYYYLPLQTDSPALAALSQVTAMAVTCSHPKRRV